MNRIEKLMVLVMGLWAGVANAATGASNEFRLDPRTGVRTAAATEQIQYSTAWATNLTAAQQGEAKAVVKVNPCLKTPPKYLVVDMSGGRSAARWPISYLDEVPSGGWTDEYKTEKLVLRYIPAGSFIMGGRATDYPGAVNTNLHMVTLTKPFYIGVFECTQRQWELAMGARPSSASNTVYYAERPVESVSYNDLRGAQLGQQWPRSAEVDEGTFVCVLRMKTGFDDLDLPTEAQWEYACRAGTTTALNTGVNLSEMSNCVEMVSAGRYWAQGGWIANGYKYDAKVFGLASTDKATTYVGTFPPNKLGLYDMHGNVYEMCRDAWSSVCEGAIDPVGPSSDYVSSEFAIPARVVKGGSWRHPAYSCRAGFREHVWNSSKLYNVGFRICLHDATTYPSADSATILVDASGAGAADWTPMQVGTYQLTHEVQVDGTTVAPVESAFFKVEGPELNIRPQGELTNGVVVAIEGAGDWPIYYTTDGTTPTAGSTKYEGPFAIPESATVRAVAISAGGVSSEVASKELALHPALAVEDVAARQRYPWNGKVDIDCEVKGDATKKYAVTFAVEDEVGHTNLPIRTVTPADRVLPPGKYRFTWDAAADLPKGTKFGGVSVSIDAVPSPLADWKRVVTISADGYAGSETLTDVPVLVRLSSAIEGFDYADFAAPDTGADMIFTDMEGVARYPFEIDEWHRGGESLVWVKLPELKKGTKFKLAYGNPVDATSSPRQNEDGSNSARRDEDVASTMKHEVWREYAGVWHMNEDSGTAFDSTEHGLDALPSCGTNKLADVSQMVAYANGACGRARVNGLANCFQGNYLTVPSYSALKLGNCFSASGWFVSRSLGKARLIARKFSWDTPSGWELIVDSNCTTLTIRGANEPVKFGAYCPNMTNGWLYLTLIYDGDEASVFTNGCLSATGKVEQPLENELPLAFGALSNGGDASLNGQYDEIRLRGGTLSADRIKADYDMIANRDFCTYGKVGK